MRFLEIKQQKYRGFKPLVFLKRPENHSLNKSSIDADRLACDLLRFSADQKVHFCQFEMGKALRNH